MSASLKGFHRTNSQPAVHACQMSDLRSRRCLHWAGFFNNERTCVRSVFLNTRSSGNSLQYGYRDAPCVQPSSQACGRCRNFLHATLESSSVVVRITLQARRAKLLRRAFEWLYICLMWSTMRLMAGTRVNSRHEQHLTTLTLHDCLLNNQLQRPCSACYCNQVSSLDNDTHSQERCSLKKE